MSHIWTTLVRGDRDFDRNIDKLVVSKVRNFFEGPYSLAKSWGNIINVTKPYYDYRVEMSVGRPQEIAEGVQEVPLVMPLAGPDMKIRTRLIGLGALFSKEALDDLGDLPIKRTVPKIMERMAEQREIDFAKMLFGNPTVYDPLRDLSDGVAWASTAHPVGVMGGTWSNTFSQPTALSEQALAEVVNAFMTQLDWDGELSPWMGTTFELGVHPSQLQKARQIVLSQSTLTLDQNSGVKNLSNVGGITWDVRPLLYSPSTTAWYVRAKGMDEEGGLDIIQRQAPTQPKKKINENPDQVQYYSKGRWGMGITNPRGLFFSPGA